MLNKKGHIFVELLIVLSFSSLFIYSFLFLPIDLLKQYNEFNNKIDIIYDLNINIKENYKKVEQNILSNFEIKGIYE